MEGLSLASGSTVLDIIYGGLEIELVSDKWPPMSDSGKTLKEEEIA